MCVGFGWRTFLFSGGKNMNTQLYDYLVQAKQFLIRVQNNEHDLQCRRNTIKNSYYIDDKYIRNALKLKNTSNFKWSIFILASILTAGFGGFIYMMWAGKSDEKLIKKEKEEIENWKTSPQGIKAKAEEKKVIDSLEKEYETKRAEYGKYFSDNYQKYSNVFSYKIKTVDNVKHQIEYVEGLMRYVKNGAPTLSEAQRRYGEDLRFERELEEKREREELEERRHKEEIQALDTIAKNQQKTIDELNRMYREKYKHI